MPAAIFPGSFDPPTLGHLHIIERASRLFQPLYIAVGHNPDKTAHFTIEERLLFLRQLTVHLPQVEVIAFQSLLVDFARQIQVSTVVRAFRGFGDLEEEVVQAGMNHQMEKLETVFLAADEHFRLISSTHVREIGKRGRRLHAFVPSAIEEAVFRKLSS